MNLELIKLLVNVALFILIWMVQLVIYPGFSYFEEKNLKQWHQRYTRNITLIVLPLMLGQLVLYGQGVFCRGVSIDWMILVLIGIIWAATFLISVPLHNKIQRLSNTALERKKLTQTNWIRTILWTLILIISLINYGK